MSNLKDSDSAKVAGGAPNPSCFVGKKLEDISDEDRNSQYYMYWYRKYNNLPMTAEDIEYENYVQENRLIG